MEGVGVDDDKHSGVAHCLIFPFPIQGHINPMLQFANRLHQKGVARITLLVSHYIAKRVRFWSPAVSLESFSDGFDDGIPLSVSPEAAAARFHEVARSTLRDAMWRLVAAGRPASCMVYDSFIPWALDAAREFGLASAAAFFTQSCAVSWIYHQVSTGELPVPLPSGHQEIVIPGLPPLEAQDMPSFIHEYESCPTMFQSAIDQFRDLEKVDWVLFNTFYDAEEVVINQMTKSLSVRTIGPAIPSTYLDNDTQNELSVFSPATETCREWLDQQELGSVIYVSFGSLARLGEAQMEELARGLELTGRHFLWIVRESEQAKLPRDLSKLEKALIVGWCHQLEVLAHPAVGCFVTHCGWNSTLEAVSLGIPLVAVPQWTDQATNAKFVADVWKVGVRVDQAAGDDGVIGREAIRRCVWEVMEGERSEEIRRNAAAWKGRAGEAMDDGGSSDRNIEQFVSSIVGSVASSI